MGRESHRSYPTAEVTGGVREPPPPAPAPQVGAGLGVGAREPHRSLPPSGTSGGFLDPMGASDFDPAAFRAQAQFLRPAPVRRFPGLCFSRVTSVRRIPAKPQPRNGDSGHTRPSLTPHSPRLFHTFANVFHTLEEALPHVRERLQHPRGGSSIRSRPFDRCPSSIVRPCFLTRASVSIGTSCREPHPPGHGRLDGQKRWSPTP